jgi:hypothetical protein
VSGTKDASERVASFIAVRTDAGGLDPDLIYTYNFDELRLSDLSALLARAVGAEAERDAALAKIAAATELATELAQQRDWLTNGHRASDYGHDILTALDAPLGLSADTTDTCGIETSTDGRCKCWPVST